MNSIGYDVIADVHGQNEKLEALLAVLGYKETEGCYRHPTRKAVFLGDLIDRGSGIPNTLRIVRAMVEAESAFAVLGNHELNAIAYHTPARDAHGGFLRPHNHRNNAQHAQTVEQFRDREAELRDYLRWFASLPLFLDLGGLRIVHACWHEGAIRALGGCNRLGLSMLSSDGTKENRIGHEAVNLLLKGPEIEVPGGVEYGPDRRTEMRVKWWLNGDGLTYRDVGMQVPAELLTDEPLKKEDRGMVCGYPEEAPPVIVGHYGFKKPPEPMAPNVAIIDLGAYKDGPLCAYRWGGERILESGNFILTEKSQ